MMTFSSLFWLRRAIGGAGAVAAMAVGLLVAGAHGAAADPITLGSAGSFGLLLGTNETLTTNGLHVGGDVGLSSNDKVKLSGYFTVGGDTYLDGTPSVSGGGGYVLSGSTITQSMTSIVADAASASTTAGALAANLTVPNNAINVNSATNSIVIQAVTNLSENVLNISSLALSNGTITFDDNGYTNAKFIINVTGNFSLTNGAFMQGINGASADDIIFNIEGTGTTVNLVGNSSTSIIGTILAPQRNVNLGGGGNLTGAIIAGVNNAGKAYNLNQSGSGYNITSLGFTPRSTSTNTPEPSSIALFGAGVSALVAARRRRKR
jgi:choice-of-anchor A domain-containing protein